MIHQCSGVSVRAGEERRRRPDDRRGGRAYVLAKLARREVKSKASWPMLSVDTLAGLVECDKDLDACRACSMWSIHG